jgi:hypothetical protein
MSKHGWWGDISASERASLVDSGRFHGNGAPKFPQADADCAGLDLFEQQGRTDAELGYPEDACPFPGAPTAEAWRCGWLAYHDDCAKHPCRWCCERAADREEDRC